MSTQAHVLYGFGEERRRSSSRAVRSAVSLLIPFVVFAIQLAFWRYLQPFAWVLFYPAVMASSWIGGLRYGLFATFVTTGLVWWFFVPPEYGFEKDLDRLIPAAVYISLGVITSLTHSHVRKANDRIREANEQRRIFEAFIENSSDFIGVADVNGNAKYLNPAGRRLVGMTPDFPLANVRPPDFYPPELRAQMIGVLKAMQAHDPWQAETTFRNWKTGERIPVSQVRFSIRDPETRKMLGLGTIVRDMTERERLERTLRETTADLARAQAVAGVGSWRLDVRKNELVWSDESYRIFGVPAGTPLTYETFLACVHPDDRAYVDEKWKAALAGATYDIEHRVVANGEIRWVREKADLAFESGVLLGGIGITQDLTSRKQLEEDLRMSEARASGIVSIAVDAIISIDEQQRITLFNEGAQRIFGWSKSEAMGKPLDIVIPERLRALHRQHVETFARGDEVSRHMGERAMPIIGLRKSGEEFPVDASISKLEVAGKRILTVAMRDVTDERRVETEQRFLAEVGAVLGSTIDYEKTLTNIVDLAVRELADYCVIDLVEPSGQVHRFRAGCRDRKNDWICDILTRVQIDRKQPYLTGPVLDTLRPAIMDDITPEVLQSYARSEEHLKALLAMDARSTILAPLVVGGRLLGAIGLTACGSSRRYGPRDIPLVEELARRAALSVENARLYATAQHAIESRDDVMGIVAHDLRNPLNSIALHASLLGRTEAAREGAETIGRAAKRMNKLIQDLLDVTQMEGSRLPLDCTRVFTPQVVFDVVSTQKELAARAGIDLRVELEDDVPDVWADRDRAFRIFENLIGNAMKFTERGGVVTVSAAREGAEVVFSVADTGAGIPLEDQPHVFDRFWQGRKARRHGAGLGLPIVKGIVEAHGGRIWLESTPGRGTKFSFTLPCASSDRTASS